MDLLHTIFIVVLISISALVYFLKRNLNYWKQRKVPYIPALPLIGNLKDVVFMKHTLCEGFDTWYNHPAAKDKDYVGVHVFANPALLLRHPEHINKICISDHPSFCDRFSQSNRHSDPFGALNLFMVNNPLWKKIRAKLSPFFTTGHLKQMFSLIGDCGNEMNQYLMKIVPENGTYETDAKELAVRFTTENIATCAFGVRGNCIENDNAEFLQRGLKMFNFTYWRSLELTAIFLLPFLGKLMRARLFSKETDDFIRNMLRNVIKEREKTGIKRNDLIDTLIAIKNDTSENAEDYLKSEDFLFAQASVFFSAGFETSSTEISFALFELAKHQTLQLRLRNEIKQMLIKTKGQLIYDDIYQMEYLDMVVKETMRLYPSVPFLERICVNENGYKLDSGVTIPNGMEVIIPIYSLQRDAKYFDDPLTFDPERFSPKNIKSMVSNTYAPFGIGNRACIGMRLGLIQVKVGIIAILMNHKVKLASGQSSQVKFNSKALILQNVGGLNLSLSRDIMYTAENNK